MKRILPALLLLFTLPGVAAIEIYEFDNPRQEALYTELIEELRCLVCQNQNLADSNAELAIDLRRKTYEMVRQGRGREDIVAFMVQRYGDFVLYRPPLKSSTLPLWLGPFLMLLAGLAVLFNMVRRRRRLPPVELSDEDTARASALLRGEEKEERP